MPSLWPESYPNLVDRAGLYRAAGQYQDAAIEYLRAAAIAPFTAAETYLLREAWWCAEHAENWLSRLEPL